MFKGWITDKIKNGELFGWLLESESFDHLTAVVVVDGREFETLCNRPRTKPVKFPLHKNFGFRISLPADFIESMQSGAEILLKEKNSGDLVYRCSLRLNDESSVKAHEQSVITGAISPYVRDNTVTGFLASIDHTTQKLSESSDKCIAEVIIEGQRHICVARCKGTYTDKRNRSFKDVGFKIRLLPDQLSQLPQMFSVRLSDLKTGKLIEQRMLKRPVLFTPSNFDDYLKYSMISPVVYAPFDESYKRCFAMMENVCSFLESKSDDQKLCSVIMPVYNRSGCVSEAIQSVLAQSHHNFELIIVDDGSTDETSKVVSSFKDTRISVITCEQNRGCAAARNLGLEKARGKYVFYLDSDNLWDPRYLKAMIGAFNMCEKADALYCGQYLFGKDLESCMAVRFASFNPSLLDNRNYIDLNCFAHKREIIERVGVFNSQLRRLVDAEFILRIANKCRICSVPVLLSSYRYGYADNTITETEQTPDVSYSSSLSQDSHVIPDFLRQLVSDSGNKQKSRSISVIIPNFEGIDVLKQCVTSILNSSCRIDEIIIVDNCSSEKTVSSIIAYFDCMKSDLVSYCTINENDEDTVDYRHKAAVCRDAVDNSDSSKTAITLLVNRHNYGFSHAVNQGLALVNPGNDVIISNNDALFHKEAAEAMALQASIKNDCGVIAPRQMLFAGQGAITSHVPFADLTRNCDVNLSAVYRNLEKVPLFSDGRDIELTYSPFFCVYIKREVLNKLPELDEEHGRHFRSDRIFCDYVRDILGYKIYYAPNAIVYHYHQFSTTELKRSSPELYRTMYEQNDWEPEIRDKFCFTERIWQEEYADTDREIWRIKNSGFFDESWYKERYSKKFPSDRQLAESPVLQCCTEVDDTELSSSCCSCSSNHRPNNREVDRAVLQNPEDIDLPSVSAGMTQEKIGHRHVQISPLEHYLTQGWKLGYRPSEYFDETFEKYLGTDVKSSRDLLRNPLLAYLRKTVLDVGNQPSYSLLKNLDHDAATRLLTVLEKQNISTDMIALIESLITAKVTEEDLALVRKSKLFDKKWYQKKYPESGTGILDPLQHYLLIGWAKGYDPSPSFNSSYYLEFNSDVKKACVCPLLHYIKSGKRDNRKIYPAFIETVPTITDRLYRGFKDRDPLISIIVASYNYADLITGALDSILAQTYRNYEVIIVDDGSSDDSVKVIEKYLGHEQFQLFTHENHVNRGLPETIKLGLEKSKGDYIAFLEADDLWEMNYLEEKVKCIKRYADVRIVTNDLMVFGDRSESEINGIRKHILDVNTRFSATRTYISAEEFRKVNWIFTFSCTMVNRTELIKCDIDRNPVKANLDWWLWRQVCLDSPVYYVNKKLTRWRLHDSYMKSARLSSRLNMELFQREGDRLLLSTKYSKARSLSQFTDKDYTFVNGDICKDGKALQEQPEFSIIMPTFNRVGRVGQAIDSLLNQAYRHFELLIVDDGSSDGTSEEIQNLYTKEVSEGQIRLVYNENNCGVSNARNIALKLAKNPWIAYLDSDNIACPLFLASYAEQIVKNPTVRAMYGMVYGLSGHREIGCSFDIESLRKENFIDLNAYCHSRELYQELGDFDTNMKRLVDWDLILRYSERYRPQFINHTLVLYDDSETLDRITTSVDLYDSFNYERKKQNRYPIVTTVITTYNHENFIREAIESAVVQRGEFIHEILISDDGSTDRTREIVKEYASRYPNIIRDISSETNLGISKNMKKCFEQAKGEYIAILEGDDYWIDKSKLDVQLSFMIRNKDCSMVFSRIQLLKDGKISHLPRQNNLTEKLTGDDFIKEPTLNLIANFSCCFFRASILKHLPDSLYKVRFNEIALVFFIEQKGKIGFISKDMSVYRIHDSGVWSGADRDYRIMSSRENRITAYNLCRKKYKKILETIIKNL